MTERDRLAADLEEAVPHADCLGKSVCATVRGDWAIAADRLIDLGWTRLPQDDQALAADWYHMGRNRGLREIDEERLARALFARYALGHIAFPCGEDTEVEAAAIAKAYREDTGRCPNCGPYAPCPKHDREDTDA